MEFVPVAAMLAMVKKAIDLLKYITNRDLNGALTILSAWLAGVAIVWLFSLSDFASGIEIGDMSLAGLDAAGIVIVGLSVGASAGVVNDFVSSIRPSEVTLIPQHGHEVEVTDVLVMNENSELGAIGLDTWVIVLMAFALGLIVSKVFLC